MINEKRRKRRSVKNMWWKNIYTGINNGRSYFF